MILASIELVIWFFKVDKNLPNFRPSRAGPGSALNVFKAFIYKIIVRAP